MSSPHTSKRPVFTIGDVEMSYDEVEEFIFQCFPSTGRAVVFPDEGATVEFTRQMKKDPTIVTPPTISKRLPEPLPSFSSPSFDYSMGGMFSTFFKGAEARVLELEATAKRERESGSASAPEAERADSQKVPSSPPPREQETNLSQPRPEPETTAHDEMARTKEEVQSQNAAKRARIESAAEETIAETAETQPSPPDSNRPEIVTPLTNAPTCVVAPNQNVIDFYRNEFVSAGRIRKEMYERFKKNERKLFAREGVETRPDDRGTSRCFSCPNLAKDGVTLYRLHTESGNWCDTPEHAFCYDCAVFSSTWFDGKCGGRTFKRCKEAGEKRPTVSSE